jgi:hypothetical protein
VEGSAQSESGSLRKLEKTEGRGVGGEAVDAQPELRNKLIQNLTTTNPG